MKTFYVQVKNNRTNDIVKELGPMSERKAVKVANGMDINMSEDFFTEVVEKEVSNVGDVRPAVGGSERAKGWAS